MQRRLGVILPGHVYLQPTQPAYLGMSLHLGMDVDHTPNLGIQVSMYVTESLLWRNLGATVTPGPMRRGIDQRNPCSRAVSFPSQTCVHAYAYISMRT